MHHGIRVLTEFDLKYGMRNVLNIDGNLETLYETFSAQLAKET